jgi:prephenate dehydratase
MTNEDRRAQIDDHGRQLPEPHELPEPRELPEPLELPQPLARRARAVTGAASQAPPPRVAFQGEHGAFSEEAVGASFGGHARVVPYASLEDLFAGLAAGGIDFAVAPVENTLFGSVHRTLDLLLASTLHVVGESVIRVRHQLVGCRGATFAGVRTVESHPVALGQCERFFAAHSHLTREASDDTAASVRRVCASGDPSRAAIGSSRAARLHGGVILRRDLQDHPRNYTRFLVLAPSPAAPPAAPAVAAAASAMPAAGPLPAAGAARPKLALAIKLAHAPGTLHRALAPFAERGIDLLRIESRPIPGEPWRYLFYLDLQGTPADPRVRGALVELAREALTIRILGCFEAATARGAGRPHAVSVASAASAGRAAAAVSPSVSHAHRPGRKADDAT